MGSGLSQKKGGIWWVPPTCGRAKRGRHAADRADFVAVAAAQHLQQQTVENDRFRANLPTFNTIHNPQYVLLLHPQCRAAALMSTSAAVEVEHDSKNHCIWDITGSTWFCSRKRQQNKSAPRFASSLLAFSTQCSLILNALVFDARVACGPVAFVAIIANRSRQCWLPADNILTLPTLILND